MTEWMRRIWYLLNRRRLGREVEREMASHRESMGEPVRFGNALRLREEARDIWGWRWLDQTWQDVRHGCRGLRKSPSFGLTAWLILSFGIGLNLTLFQMVNLILLKPPAVKHPHSLVRFTRHSKTMTSSGVPYPATQFYRRNNTVLAAVLTQTSSDVAWGDNAGDRVRCSFVSANFFEELGYGAAYGRVFNEAEDEKPDAPPVVLLSHVFWETRFDRDPGVISRTVRINDRPATVIGVVPVSFPGLRLNTSQVWVPMSQIDYFHTGSETKNEWGTEMYARLRPGISLSAAREGMKPAVREFARQRPQVFSEDEYLEPSASTGHFAMAKDRQEIWTIVLLIAGLTLLVLIVACANLSSLVLSRANHRLREFSIRLALGAGRWRIVRQLLTESLLLLGAGLVTGMLLGYEAAKTLAAQFKLPPLDFTPDWRALLAGLSIALFSLLLFGLLPALRIARQDLTSSMKDGAQQSSGGLQRTRLQRVLVGTQVAGSCVLLIVAGLMARGLQRLLAADPGFDFVNVVVLEPSLRLYGIKGEAARAYWGNVRHALAAHRETESLALVSLAPLGRNLNETIYPDATDLKVMSSNVEPEFFPLMRIPILAGRNFQASDDYRTTIIISKRLAERMYGTMNVVGQGFPKTRPDKTIIGIAGDANLIKIQANNVAERYSLFYPGQYEDLLLIARARAHPDRLLEPMRTAARQADDRVLAHARLMKLDFESKLQAPRLTSLIATLVGLLTLSLACLGIFGLISYAVSLRTKEIGVRVALGARSNSILGLLLRQLLWPVALGIVIGTGSAVVVGTMLGGDPFYLRINDPAGSLAALLVLVLTGGLAAIVPARRALRIDPMRALRHE